MCRGALHFFTDTGAIIIDGSLMYGGVPDSFADTDATVPSCSHMSHVVTHRKFLSDSEGIPDAFRLAIGLSAS